MKSFLSKLFFVLIFLFCSIHLYVVLEPLLEPEMITGWDFLPQYYLVHNMQTLLQGGGITGYDLNWFAGYPAFSYYGPLSYMAVTGVAELLPDSGDSVQKGVYAFNLVVFALPFCSLCLALLQARFVFGRGYGSATAFLSLIVLLFAGMSHVAPVSIYTTLLHGHFASFFAFVLLQALSIAFSLQYKHHGYFSRLLSILLTSAIILTHILTALFVAIWLFGIVLFGRSRGRKEALITGGVAMFVTAFWWFPLLQTLWLTSGKAITTPLHDPVLSFLPQFFTLKDCFQYFSLESLIGIPFAGILFAISLVVGLVSLLRKQEYLFPLSFLGLLLLLPRGILTVAFSIPVHSYRFIFPLFAFALPIAGVGLVVMTNTLFQLHRGTLVIRTGLYFLLFLIAFQISVSLFGVRTQEMTAMRRLYLKASAACGGVEGVAPLEKFSDTRRYSDFKEMVDYISYYRPTGRVAVEINPHETSHLGTPHAFTTILPMMHQIPVVPGLLAESSLSASFLIPTISYGSSSLLWGRSSLYDRAAGLNPFANSQFEVQDMMKRLSVYGIQYVVTTSPQYKNALSRLSAENSQLEKAPTAITTKLRFEAGPYALFELSQFAKHAYHSTYRPFLYVERGGPDFRTFAEEWFKEETLFSYPVLYTPERFSDLPKGIQDQIGGFIFSYQENWISVTDAEYEEFQKIGKPVILLNRKDRRAAEAEDTPDLHFISYFDKNTTEDTNGGLIELRGILRSYSDGEPVWQVTHEDEALRQPGVGTLITDSYHPSWQTYRYRREMMLATPSFIYLPPEQPQG